MSFLKMSIDANFLPEMSIDADIFVGDIKRDARFIGDVNTCPLHLEEIASFALSHKKLFTR